uniref:Uncharacterized protein n=1 Tax=Arundo donax TaxID=35708 RepID=A0A0A9BPT9_ARUDO
MDQCAKSHLVRGA